MSKDVKKHRQVRLYLNDENQTTLKELGENQPDLSEAQIVSILMSACLRAVKENNYRLTLPLKLKISDAVEESPRSLTPKIQRK